MRISLGRQRTARPTNSMCHRLVASRFNLTWRQTGVFIAQNSSATYQRDMRESLRKISQLTLCARIVLFREQSKIVAHIEQPLEQFSCFFFSAEQMPAIPQPTGPWKKYSFYPRP